MADRDRWILHIKELREKRSIGILDAERLALTDPQWRRWLERQINNDDRCRRMALSHIRHNREMALIARQGDRLVIR